MTDWIDAAEVAEITHLHPRTVAENYAYRPEFPVPIKKEISDEPILSRVLGPGRPCRRQSVRLVRDDTA